MATGIGIPPLLNGIAQKAQKVSLLAADVALVLSFFTKPKWGIYKKDGTPLIIADSVVSLDYRAGSMISNFPVENGAFASYNKVAHPYGARVTLTKGGTEAERTQFLNTLETASASLDLYDVFTPEKAYHNANIERYDYRRTAHNGVTLLTAEITLVEVRQVQTAAFTQTKAASGADPVNGGTVQTSAAPAAVSMPPAQPIYDSNGNVIGHSRTFN